MFKEIHSQKCNTYFTNIERLYTATNDDSFLFSKQIQDLADELIHAVPKIPEEPRSVFSVQCSESDRILVIASP